MSFVPKKRYTVEEYLALEERSEYRSEYYRGEIFAMAGGTPAHNDIAVNIIREVDKALHGKSKCKVYVADMQLLVKSKELYTYPDVMVACPPVFEGRALTNPSVIFEVLSKSTASYDRGEKLRFYRSIESLQEYILVSQTTPRVERFIRQTDGSWSYVDTEGLNAAFEIASLRATLSLAGIYEDVTLVDEAPDIDHPEICLRPEE